MHEMSPLTDPRPHVFSEAPVDALRPHLEAQVAGLLLINLLQDYPDVDLPTVRLWRHSADGVPTMRVDARRGELAGVECPQCHQPAGRPHTEYCTLQLREEVFAASFEGPDPTPVCGLRDLTRDDMPACKYPPHPVAASHSWQDFGQTSQPATRTPWSPTG